MKKIQVYLVDDHPLVREGLAAFIQAQSDIHVCGTGDNINGVLNDLARLPVDVLILDLTLKNESGFDLLKQVLHRFPVIKSIVLTMHKSGQMLQQTQKSGARGFVLKEESTQVIIQAIRAVMAGGCFWSNRVDQAFSLLPPEDPVQSGDVTRHLAADLSKREQEILYYLGQGKKSSEIGEILSVSARTVDAHRQNIKKKLQLQNFSEITAFAARWASKID